MEIKYAQTIVDNWIKEFGVRYFDEKTNTLVLVEEVGEFASLIARKYGEQSFKIDFSKKEINEKIKEELGDIFFVLICLSNQMGYDLEEILKSSLDKKTKRDKNRHKHNPKLNKD
ncbi:MAG: pyrophosphatase [Saprospirales bacterium]|nr:MAG: pyrophosphatase [Saprospirales bacterium]